MRIATLVAVILLPMISAGCNDASGPEDANLTGVYAGAYTTSIDPSFVYEGVVQLTQRGANVSGTFTAADRFADVSAAIVDGRLQFSFIFKGACPGVAQGIAEIRDRGDTLLGTYQATDCLGSYAGTFSFQRV